MSEIDVVFLRLHLCSFALHFQDEHVSNCPTVNTTATLFFLCCSSEFCREGTTFPHSRHHLSSYKGTSYKWYFCQHSGWGQSKTHCPSRKRSNKFCQLLGYLGSAQSTWVKMIPCQRNAPHNRLFLFLKPSHWDPVHKATSLHIPDANSVHWSSDYGVPLPAPGETQYATCSIR